MNSDFKELLKCINEFQIEYMIAGGYAVMEYTEPRYTKDLDIWIRASTENANRVFKALAAFGAPLGGMTASDFEDEGSMYQMGMPPIRIDILMSVSGLTFDEAWQNRTATILFGENVWMVAPTDLVKNKRAAGRPQDMIDVKNLEDTLAKRAE